MVAVGLDKDYPPCKGTYVPLKTNFSFKLRGTYPVLPGGKDKHIPPEEIEKHIRKMQRRMKALPRDRANSTVSTNTTYTTKHAPTTRLNTPPPAYEKSLPSGHSRGHKRRASVIHPDYPEDDRYSYSSIYSDRTHVPQPTAELAPCAVPARAALSGSGHNRRASRPADPRAETARQAAVHRAASPGPRDRTRRVSFSNPVVAEERVFVKDSVAAETHDQYRYDMNEVVNWNLERNVSERKRQPYGLVHRGDFQPASQPQTKSRPTTAAVSTPLTTHTPASRANEKPVFVMKPVQKPTETSKNQVRCGNDSSDSDDDTRKTLQRKPTQSGSNHRVPLSDLGAGCNVSMTFKSVAAASNHGRKRDAVPKAPNPAAAPRKDETAPLLPPKPQAYRIQFLRGGSSTSPVLSNREPTPRQTLMCGAPPIPLASEPTHQPTQSVTQIRNSQPSVEKKIQCSRHASLLPVRESPPRRKTQTQAALSKERPARFIPQYPEPETIMSEGNPWSDVRLSRVRLPFNDMDTYLGPARWESELSDSSSEESFDTAYSGDED